MMYMLVMTVWCEFKFALELKLKAAMARAQRVQAFE
jgi:hypothetical protein